MERIETQKNLSGKAGTSQTWGEAEQHKSEKGAGLARGRGGGACNHYCSKLLKSIAKSCRDPRDRGHLLAHRIIRTREIGIVPKIKAESAEIAQGHRISRQQSRDLNL